MQTKMILTSIVVLFFTMITKAQEPVYTSTTNKTELPNFSPVQVNVKAETDGTIFGLWIHNPEKKKLPLLIFHNLQGVVVDTLITTEGYACRYNMEQVEDGRYTIVVGSGRDKIVRELDVRTVVSRSIKVNTPR